MSDQASYSYEQLEDMGQPQGLYRLFFAEMWERFSYYGMRSLLTLYMVRELLYADDKSFGIYAAYTSLVYATPLLGGYFADKILGYKRAIILGGSLMAIGHFVMAIQNEFFFFGALALIIMGNGFFKPNISSMVGGLYQGEKDPRRDKGFTIFYMGINIGALAAPLICGLIGETIGWHYGFGLAGVGMLIGLLNFLTGQKIFERNGEPQNPEYFKKYSWLVYVGAFGIVPLLSLLVVFNSLINYIVIGVFLIVVAVLGYQAFKSDKVQRERLGVIIILLFFSIMFWAFFELAGSALTLFTDRNVDRTLLGLEIPASTFQSVNPAFIVALAPLFSMLWRVLDKRGLEPTTPFKFGLGILQLGLGFGIFVLGGFFANSGEVALIFLILGYLLHTTGELCLSPIGLSMVTKLSPPTIVALVMGAWFFSSAAGIKISGEVAKATSASDAQVHNISYVPNEEAKTGPQGKIAAFGTNDRFVLTAIERDEDGTKQDSASITINVKRDGETADALRNWDQVPFRLYAATQPGEPVDLNLNSESLDPKGKNSTYKLLGGITSGSVEMQDPETGQAVYTPDTGFTGSDTLRFMIQDTRDTLIRDTLQYIITVDSKKDFAPRPVQEELTLYTYDYKKKYLGGLFSQQTMKDLSIRGEQVFYHPENQPMDFKVQEKPSAGFTQLKTEADTRLGQRRTLQIYTSVFFWIFVVAGGVGVLLIAISPLVARWMHGVR